MAVILLASTYHVWLCDAFASFLSSCLELVGGDINPQICGIGHLVGFGLVVFFQEARPELGYPFCFGLLAAWPFGLTENDTVELGFSPLNPHAALYTGFVRGCAS